VRALVIAILLTCALIGGANWLISRNPSWWRDVKPLDPETSYTAEQVENGVVTQLSLARPADGESKGYKSQPWSVSLTDSDANAWLATRLKQWTENRGVAWPAGISDPQVSFSEGVVHLGVRTHGQVVSVALAPTFRPDGSLWLAVEGTALGGLPLPTDHVLTNIESGARTPKTQHALDIIQGKEALLKDPVIKLEDGRVVRLLKLIPKDGRLEVTCRTEK
jgi:hypothetical protein